MISKPARIYANSYTNVARRYVNLFEFSDFRKYLEAYQVARQAVDKSFTRSQFCKEIGLPNTRSYFNDIVKGSRNLSKAYVERFIAALSMTEEEAQYFRILVFFAQSTYERDLAKILGEKTSLGRWQKTAIFNELNMRVSLKSLKWLSTQNQQALL